MERGLIRDHELEFALFFRLADLFIICASLYACLSLYQVKLSDFYGFCCAIICLSYLVCAESGDLYRSWRMNNFRRQVGVVFVSWVVAILVLLVCAYFSKTSEIYSRLVMGTWFLSAPALILAWRFVVQSAKGQLRSHGFNSRRAAIIGLTENGVRLGHELEKQRDLGIVLDGYYDDRCDNRLQNAEGLHCHGTVKEAIKRAKNADIDQIYIAMPLSAKDRIAQYLKEFSDTTANTYIVPDFFTYNLMHSRWNNVGDVQTFSVYDTPFYGLTSWVKRAEDIIFSSLALLVLSPVMLTVAAGVKLSSRGPVLFKQDRYGLDGRKIKVWKFRSMRTMENGDKVTQATRDDPRVTRFGAFIRRTSLDELPQFFNVLQGDMSIVGPRPHAVAHNEQYRSIVDRYMLRHKVKPGITGLAQINGFRGETDTLDKMERRVEYDLKYINDWSIWMDVKIIGLTAIRGFTGHSAY
ncbi:undecaprenyl-phosphate glucose phosphotransferase [Paraferrimonas sedimenticola]|uniref:Undecaprenyl-phosphate glucose phosphotransferase n=1 Tax=Paraferrimonas sedimenticola TaxID=375674 RepID=A0AA37RUY4_9GAMM|nr:undecaprenyl-phosphate glucose phosphotransferase [Paraferrimonas sedimenticola]GLP95716.1 undecaprenyl-phosphate glucose phosphotransferase [Paraferrimonas sedimenticola]